MSHGPTLTGFMAGAISAGLLIAGLFFLKFWRTTRDGLFLAFAAAFALLALGQTILVLVPVPDENIAGVYLLRLSAFLLIIWAILRKNFKGR